MLLHLFKETVRRVNCQDYNPEQVHAWASVEIDQEAWASRFSGRFVPLAEVDGQIAGFGELSADGYIDRFYVSADHQKIGVGRALMAAIEAEAIRLGIKELYANVSITARPFFERSGFIVITPQEVVVRGQVFQNFRMARALDGMSR